MKTFIAMGLFAALFGCSRGPTLKEGALYTVNDGDGFYRVAEILVLDKQGVHIRLYKNKWKERPAAVEGSSLSLGGVNDPEGFGVGHLPLSTKAFAGWQPIFVRYGTVAKDELEGYQMWREGGGGYFGK